ncbi:TPA: hypothetical protein EYN65_24355 [Candidatus Poribacteria bacterium]|nr:hypothetical protein [Candidatus Poribacteria bacterium]
MERSPTDSSLVILGQHDSLPSITDSELAYLPQYGNRGRMPKLVQQLGHSRYLIQTVNTAG